MPPSSWRAAQESFPDTITRAFCSASRGELLAAMQLRCVMLLLMARKIIHQLVDDIDGTVLEVGDGETILFSLDGIAYEIDLSAENAAALRDALSTYTSAGRRVSSGRSAAAAPAAAGRRRAGQRDLGVVREWAKANGFKVSERGRVPASILEAYDDAH